jgi:hypothetical protein
MLLRRTGGWAAGSFAPLPNPNGQSAAAGFAISTTREITEDLLIELIIVVYELNENVYGHKPLRQSPALNGYSAPPREESGTLLFRVDASTFVEFPSRSSKTALFLPF